MNAKVGPHFMRLFPLLFLLPMLAACASSPKVELRGQAFTVEIADEFAEQRQGLMFREELDRNAGMLFIFPREAPRSFWMKNCKINLDILYFDADLKLINGHYDVPPCRRDPCRSYPSRAPARYVLELNGGRARELGVQPGDVLTLEL